MVQTQSYLSIHQYKNWIGLAFFLITPLPIMWLTFYYQTVHNIDIMLSETCCFKQCHVLSSVSLVLTKSVSQVRKTFDIVTICMKERLQNTKRDKKGTLHFHVCEADSWVVPHAQFNYYDCRIDIWQQWIRIQKTAVDLQTLVFIVCLKNLQISYLPTEA